MAFHYVFEDTQDNYSWARREVSGESRDHFRVDTTTDAGDSFLYLVHPDHLVGHGGSRSIYHRSANAAPAEADDYSVILYADGSGQYTDRDQHNEHNWEFKNFGWTSEGVDYFTVSKDNSSGFDYDHDQGDHFTWDTLITVYSPKGISSWYNYDDGSWAWA